MRRLFALLLLAALVGGGYYYWKMAGRPPRDLGELGQRLEDVRLTASVKTALALNRRLAGASLEASTTDGVVTLRGSAPAAEARQLAAEIAAAVPGIRRVVNDLETAPGAAQAAGDDRSLGERLDDEALEAKIRLAFTLNRELHGAAIDVVVRRRRVVLSGDVARASQKQRALQVAADVPDVNGVADGLRVGSQTH